jgi:hypothetical protein
MQIRTSSLTHILYVLLMIADIARDMATEHHKALLCRRASSAWLKFPIVPRRDGIIDFTICEAVHHLHNVGSLVEEQYSSI